jgi:hypothetical protein
MLRACLATLVVLGALFGLYYWWLSKQFDPPGVYIGAVIMALVAGGSLGALINSGVSYREWSLASAARHDLPWRDGRWTAAAGTIHPVGEPVIAPFSGEECVLCEYDVADSQRVANRSDDSNPGSDFTGFLMNPCVVRTNQGDIKVLGFPNLSDFGERTLDGPEVASNARAFLLSADFEDYSGLKMVSIVSAIKEAWNDEDGYVRKNVRLTKSSPESLFPPGHDEQPELPAPADTAADPGGMLPEIDAALPMRNQAVPPGDNLVRGTLDEEDHLNEMDEDFDEDEFDDDLDEDLDDDLSDDALPSGLPLLKERRVKVGERVCAIGIYNEQQRGLVPGGLGADRFVKLVRGDLGKVEREARGATYGRLIGGFVGLVLVHAVAYGIVMANRHHPSAVKDRQRDAINAVGKGDLPALEKLVARGLRVNDRSDQNETLLSKARSPEAVQWLIDHGADVNAKTNGRTPLMDAAYLGQAAIAKALIDAKADLDEESDTDGHWTAIDFARTSGREDIVALLLAAGSKPGDVTVDPK